MPIYLQFFRDHFRLAEGNVNRLCWFDCENSTECDISHRPRVEEYYLHDHYNHSKVIQGKKRILILKKLTGSLSLEASLERTMWTS